MNENDQRGGVRLVTSSYCARRTSDGARQFEFSTDCEGASSLTTKKDTGIYCLTMNAFRVHREAPLRQRHHRQPSLNNTQRRARHLLAHRDMMNTPTHYQMVHAVRLYERAAMFGTGSTHSSWQQLHHVRAIERHLDRLKNVLKDQLLLDSLLQKQVNDQEKQWEVQEALLRQEGDAILRRDLELEEREATLRERVEYEDEAILEIYKQQEQKFELQIDVLRQERLELVRTREAAICRRVLQAEETEAWIRDRLEQLDQARLREYEGQQEKLQQWVEAAALEYEEHQEKLLQEQILSQLDWMEQQKERLERKRTSLQASLAQLPADRRKKICLEWKDVIEEQVPSPRPECVACYSTDVPLMVHYPCGHQCLCQSCANRLCHTGQQSPLCPMCRQPIADILPVYTNTHA